MKCNLCTRKCNIDRNITKGYCNSNNKIKIAKYMLYKYEEPCISGKKGSGAIFFSGCNMKCIFCQNYEISLENYGKEIEIEDFTEICLKLQKQGAHNINLITPGHYINLIKEGLIKAKEKGLTIPIVYNTNCLETIETIKSLDNIIDIYLPDFKYYNDEYAKKYSNTNKYVENTKKVIEEMYRQVGKPKFENNIMTKGIIVRHLMLPTLEEDTKKILEYLYKKYKNNIYISIMNQYTPLKEFEYKELNRTITKEEYENIIDYAYNLGIRNAFVQEEGTQKESFIPNFKE